MQTQIPIYRLRKFIEGHLSGGCRILSLGSECTCALCDLDKLKEALDWYKEEAEAIAKNMSEKKDMAVLASVEVLTLDAGSRARKVTGDL